MLEQMTKNKWVDYWMGLIPEDPVTQTKFVYSLSAIVFLGLLGYTIATWYDAVVNFAFTTFFRGMFMSAICLLTLIGLKQTRNAYHITKSMYGNPIPQDNTMKIESITDMMEEFNDGKDKHRKRKEKT